jgi:hypothetical protein
MKKFFGLSFIVFCSTLLFAGCLNPVDDVTGGDTTTGTTVDLKPAPLVFAFEPSPLVYDTDTIKGGERAGAFLVQGGSGTYSYELVEGRGAADNGLFTVGDGELKIAETVGGAGLDWGPYSVRVRVLDTGGLFYEEACAMEVTLAPSGVKALTVIPYMIGDTGNKLRLTWDKSVGAAGYKIFINTANDTGTAESYDFPEVPSAALRFKEITTFSGAALPKGQIYYVWITAYNDGLLESPFSPAAKVKTSGVIDTFWYEGVSKFDFANTDGYKFTSTTIEYYFSSSGLGNVADILYHEVFDPADVARIFPSVNKWDADLSGLPAGVFITKLRDVSFSNNGNLYTCVYYWGRGGYTSEGKIFSMIINPWHKRGDEVVKPEQATYEEAMETFTAEKFPYWISLSPEPYIRIMSGH